MKGGKGASWWDALISFKNAAELSQRYQTTFIAASLLDVRAQDLFKRAQVFDAALMKKENSIMITKGSLYWHFLFKIIRSKQKDSSNVFFMPKKKREASLKKANERNVRCVMLKLLNSIHAVSCLKIPTIQIGRHITIAVFCPVAFISSTHMLFTSIFHVAHKKSPYL